MSTKIATKNPGSKFELQEKKIIFQFHDIVRDYTPKLISSMSGRCKAAFAARGGSTEY